MATYPDVMEWLPQFYRVQSLEAESLEDKNLDGRITLKSGQDSPSQKPMCAYQRSRSLAKIREKMVLLRPTTVKEKKIELGERGWHIFIWNKGS